ncbi:MULTISPECIES: 4Fe-4S single cluster domain-containing protein [Anaerolinea]|uniref:4Fe-4S single cluster domain-containing protein n=1 Tax=Anaerolinea TaxID=233189 RepID=UPI002618403D|nr:4Fe-4S single cluster domain-containing protein [Anaerolinea thermophila]
MINVAEVFVGTRALGPGLRTVIWVQGCPFHCKGCYSPEWIPNIPAKLYTPQDLATLVLSRPDIEGITLSGGEPFIQSEELVEFLTLIKKQSNKNVICFSGFRFSFLLQHPSPSVQGMLRLIDVLIDGPYVQEKETSKGLRGSTNQHIYHFTSTLLFHDFINQERVNEIHISGSELLAIGIPSPEIKALFGFNNKCGSQPKEHLYERA